MYSQVGGGSGYLHVMAWDGSSPSFGWDDNGTTGYQTLGSGLSGGTISDPDIVADPDGTGLCMIVYRYVTSTASTIQYEVHDISGSSSTLMHGPATFSHSNHSDCSYPNIDVSSNGTIASVYSHVFSNTKGIAARMTSFSSYSTVTGNFDAGQCATSTNDKLQPDVAIEVNDNIVQFVFLEIDNNNNMNLKVLRAQPNDISNSINLTCIPGNNITIASYSSPVILATPRIAMPWDHQIFHPLDCYVIVQKDFEILGYIYNHQNNLYFPQQALNSGLTCSVGTAQSNNYDPAVSFVGDEIITAWTYDDQCNYLNNDEDIIVRQVHYTQGTLRYPGYSVLCSSNNNNQNKVSVAGRYSGGTTYYCWYAANASDIGYKSRHSSHQYLKISEDKKSKITELIASNDIILHENPFSQDLSFQVLIENDNGMNDFEIFDINGKSLYKQDISAYFSGNHSFQLELNNLKPGIYFLKLRGRNTNVTKTLIKQ